MIYVYTTFFFVILVYRIYRQFGRKKVETLYIAKVNCNNRNNILALRRFPIRPKIQILLVFRYYRESEM